MWAGSQGGPRGGRQGPAQGTEKHSEPERQLEAQPRVKHSVLGPRCDGDMAQEGTISLSSLESGVGLQVGSE